MVRGGHLAKEYLLAERDSLSQKGGYECLYYEKSEIDRPVLKEI